MRLRSAFSCVLASSALVSTLSGIPACTNDSGGDGPVASDTKGSPPYSLKVYVNQSGKRTRIDIAPNPPQAAPAASSTTESLGGPGLKDESNSQIFNTFDPSRIFASTPTATTLLQAAAAECGMIGHGTQPPHSDDDGYDDLARMYAQHQTVMSQTALAVPWMGPSTTKLAWYLFPTAPSTCDQVLEYEETLLCVADKLGTLADAIAPVTWNNVKYIQTGSAPGMTDWTIPPQGDEDKFVARDLALHVLAHIPWLDAFPITYSFPAGWPQHVVDGVSQPITTCSELYARYDADPSSRNVINASLWSATDTYPLDPEQSGVPRGHSRLAFETNTLRASGLLMHDLIRDSVYSDFAGAEHKRATASDPKAGGIAAWGDVNNPYNSLAHVARILAGRLELGYEISPNVDPRCAFTMDPLNLMSLANVSLTARATDVGSATGNQAMAATLFESAGLVMAPAAGVNLRSALQTQLLGMRAASRGASTSDYEASEDGAALKALVGRLSDADLAHGAQRVATNFVAATNTQPSDVATIQTGLGKVGFSASPIANADLAGAGIAVKGGLPRAFASFGDPVAEVALMNTGAMCDQTSGDWSLGSGNRFALQDIFAAASELRSRMVVLREVADGVQTASHLPPDVRARAAAVSEVGAWAGRTTVYLSRNAEDVTVDLRGVAPTDFGVHGLEDIGSQLILVAGDPLAAECAANLRTPCGPDAASNAYPAVSTEIITSGDALYRRNSGMTDGAVRVHWNVIPNTSNRSTVFYLVAKQTAEAKSGGRGSVIAVLRSGAAQVISPMRNELAQAAFGVGKWIGAAPPRVDEHSLSHSPQYCVEGLPRDIFVPLSNDLTSDVDGYENSWRHYLDLATAAAQRADDLGQKWVDIGFNQDSLAESFEPDLIKNTGEATDLDAVKFDDNGNPVPGDTNGALSAILNQVKIDLVFLTESPFGKADPNTDAAAMTTLRNILTCSGSGGQPHPLCQRLNKGAKIIKVDAASIGDYTGTLSAKTAAIVHNPDQFVTYASLDLAPHEADGDRPASMKQCEAITNVGAQMKGSPAPFQASGAMDNGGAFSAAMFNEALNGPWASSFQDISSHLQHVKMDVSASGDWTVKLAGATIMSTTLDTSSTQAPYWPACLGAPGAPSCKFDDPMTNAWNTLFRRCAADQFRSAIGSCEGTDAWGEYNALRWRIEAAMWLADTITGDVPAGAFTVPMPAVTFGAYDGGHCASISQIFGNGNFKLSDDKLSVSLDGNNPGPGIPDESERLKPYVPIDEHFHSWGPSAVDELPLEQKLAYIPGTADGGCRSNNQYVAHVFGSNADGASNFSNLADFFKKRLGYDGLPVAALDKASLGAVASALEGASQCLAPRGDFDKYVGANGAGWFQGLVASLKTQQSTASDMRGILYRDQSSEDSANGWYPWATVFGWNSDTNQWSNFRLQGEGPELLRGEWFSSSPTRYSWYYKTIGGTTHYATNVWYPIGSDDSEWLGKALWNQPDRLVAHLSLAHRVRGAVNSGSPNGDCGAAWQFAQALPFACIAAFGVTDSLMWPDPPPTLSSAEDLLQEEGWYRSTTKTAREMLGRVFLENIPAAVVQNRFTQRVSAGSAQGDFGKTVYAIGSGMGDIATKWNDVTERLAEITNAIQGTRLAIDAMNAQQDITMRNLAISHLQTEKDIIEQVANAVGVWAHSSINPLTYFGNGAVADAAATASIVIDAEIISNLDDIENDENTKHGADLKQALLTLKTTLTKNSTDIRNLMEGIRSDVANIQSNELTLQATRNAVGWDLGKAAGMGVWNCGSADQPRECASHVNTVLNRQYAAYERRYKDALKEAKSLAFIARRAIEQRIGLPLSDITSRIGSLEPPATWADDVCRLTGINYQRLRTESGLDAGLTQAQRDDKNAAEASEFADQFIGDYVQKLTDFVQYYNIVYPAHDGDDTAVISLRQDVFREEGACEVGGRNLLRSSGHLNFTVAAGSAGKGWQRHYCAPESANCLSTLSSGLAELPPDAPSGAATWLLSDAPRRTENYDTVNAGAIAGPDGLVSQAVQLEPGHYALSWWDQALDLSGTQTPSNPRGYRAGVYSDSWVPVDGTSFADNPSLGTWSQRRSLIFDIASAGTYHVAFGASLSPARPGSVAIANVQLERIGLDNVLADYQDTDSSGQVTSYACAASAATLRRSFQRNCDADGNCFWELRRPIDFDGQKMTINGYPLRGKIAVGNFNFRHVDFAVNLVGTGLHDCAGLSSQDCYASGYLEYSLDHNGDAVNILGYDNQVREFDFGIGTISHGKALAAERYITMPLNSADQGLISQPGILKPELRGRPLDGGYQLRIYDSPALRWERLDDIQLILKYRYWSRIATPGQN